MRVHPQAPLRRIQCLAACVPHTYKYAPVLSGRFQSDLHLPIFAVYLVSGPYAMRSLYSSSDSCSEYVFPVGFRLEFVLASSCPGSKLVAFLARTLAVVDVATLGLLDFSFVFVFHARACVLSTSWLRTSTIGWSDDLLCSLVQLNSVTPSGTHAKTPLPSHEQQWEVEMLEAQPFMVTPPTAAPPSPPVDAHPYRAPQNAPIWDAGKAATSFVPGGLQPPLLLARTPRTSTA